MQNECAKKELWKGPRCEGGEQGTKAVNTFTQRTEKYAGCRAVEENECVRNGIGLSEKTAFD